MATKSSSKKKKSAASTAPATTASLQPAMIPLSSILIDEGTPNRADGWEKRVTELVDSIKNIGQVVPISVVPLIEPTADGKTYRLVAGRRRIEAHERLNRPTIKAVGMSVKLSRKSEFYARIAENYDREAYTPLEEAALAFHAVNTLGASQQDYAKAVGKTVGWVSQRLAALKQPPEVQNALDEGEIKFTHVRELARVKDDGEKLKLLKRAKREGANDFKNTVDFIISGEKKARAAPKSSAKAEGGDGDGDGNAGNTAKARETKAAKAMLGRSDKAYSVAKEADDRMKAREIRGFIEGISWSFNLKGSKLPF